MVTLFQFRLKENKVLTTYWEVRLIELYVWDTLSNASVLDREQNTQRVETEQKARRAPARTVVGRVIYLISLNYSLFGVACQMGWTLSDCVYTYFMRGKMNVTEFTNVHTL